MPTELARITKKKAHESGKNHYAYIAKTATETDVGVRPRKNQGASEYWRAQGKKKSIPQRSNERTKQK